MRYELLPDRNGEPTIIGYIPWINIDWHPASKPYDIPGSSNFVGCGIK